MKHTLMKPEIINKDSRGGAIIVCDHATNFVPGYLNNLGLSHEQLSSHIGWDIGAANVSKNMAEMMDIPIVLAPVSRLVIDCNRCGGHQTLIPNTSDDVIILGNQNLSDIEIEARFNAYYQPFHSAVENIVAAHLMDGDIPLMIGMHSFTPHMNGDERPWHIGFLWDKDPRLAQALIGLIERETDLKVGDNQPYSGRDLYYTMQRHGADHGLPQTTIEIRQDLVDTPEKCRQWAALLADCLDECLARTDLMSLKHFD